MGQSPPIGPARPSVAAVVGVGKARRGRLVGLIGEYSQAAQGDGLADAYRLESRINQFASRVKDAISR